MKDDMTSPRANNSIRSLVKEAEKAASDGLYKEAESLYTRAMETDSSNPALYEGRSAMRIQLESYEDAIQDAENAVDLDPDFVSGYFRLGVALQCTGEYSQSIAAFSEGIVRDQKSEQLLNAIVEVSLLSPIKTSLEPVMSQLRKMRLDTNPFVILSVIGQELLSHDGAEDAVQVLENAVAIGTRSLKLKGSVFSALSSALWSLGDTDRAIHYMNEDLAVSRTLDDKSGECRAHGNLGAAYYSKGNYQLAMENHNKQLVLAQKMQDHKAMGSAFSSLGHVHTALNQHQGAVENHKQSAAIFRNIKDIMSWSRQLGLVSSAYSTLGDLDSALQWQLECLRVTTDEFKDGSQDAAKEEAKARVDLATVYHKMQKYTEEMSCLQKSVEINKNLGDKDAEAQSLGLLGYITRQTGDLKRSQTSYERMLELSLNNSDHAMEAKACANLGVIHHQLGDYEMALKLQARNLELSVEFRDVGAQGRAHGNIGNAYSAMGMYDQAAQHYLKELEISTMIKDQALECSTHGNLAIAYQALKIPEKALEHFNLQISLACQLGDYVNESRAYMNLANFYSSRREYGLAIQNYSKYLRIAENTDFEKPMGIAKACYNVAFAYFSLKDYPNAIIFYEKCLNISLEVQDVVSSARAYCNLGLSWKYNGDNTKAFECQNCFLALSNQLRSTRGIFKALGNMGDIYMGCKQPSDAIPFYQQQYDHAKKHKNPNLIAQAAAALGVAYRFIGDFKQSVECHTEELEIYQNLKNSKNEFRAHGHLGAVLSSLNEFSSASKCYENQCFIAQKLEDKDLQSTALGNMGITAINEQDYEKAIDFFERQLLIVEKMPNSGLEKAKILCNIGDCYEAVENYQEAITLFEEALEFAIKLTHEPSLERVYRGLSSAYKLSNKPKEAFKYCKLRVEICLQMGNKELLAESFGEMGYLFTILTDFESALTCFKLQMKYGESFPQVRGDAACGLGSVYHMLRNFKKSLEYHQLDLEIAAETKSLPCQGRAHGNLGTVYEALHDHMMAIKHQEQHLFIADSQNDPLAKLTALRGVARNVLRAGTNNQRAALLLQQALLLARELNAKEDEGKIILDLGLTNWVCDDLKKAETHIQEAKGILMEEFWKSGVLDIGVNTSVHPNLCIDLFEELLTCQSALTVLYANLNRQSEALRAAEELRKFPQRVIERVRDNKHNSEKTVGNLEEKLSDYAQKQDSVIFYYSIQAGFLFLWVFTPEEGLVGFINQKIFSANDNEQDEMLSNEENNILSQLLSGLRDSLGLESPCSDPEESSSSGDNEDRISFPEEEVSDKIPELNDKLDVGFQTYHRLLEAQVDMHYSKNLTSLGLNGSLTDSPKNSKSPVYSMHSLLIGEMQEKIKKYASKRPQKSMVLVLEGDLFMVPFSLLKRRPTESYLAQQFHLRVVNSASDLFAEDQRSNCMGQLTRAAIICNPDVGYIGSVPQSQATEDEANMVGTLLKVEPITRKNATKETVLQEIQMAECLHFACNLSEKPPYRFFLSSGMSADENSGKSDPVSSDTSNTDSGYGRDNNLMLEEMSDIENEEISLTSKQIHERSLAMHDVLDLDLSKTKIALLGSAYLQEIQRLPDKSSFRARTTRILTVMNSFLHAGAHSLLLSLWPVPETAYKLVMQSFYSRLMNGMPSCEALTQSLDILRNSEQFEHPSYWAGFIIIGQNVTLDSKNLPFYNSLRLLVESDAERLQDIIKLVLHLIDKALERMTAVSNSSVPMYASQASIGKKVQYVNGWREFFSAIGFELRQSSGVIPDAVFFPKSELKDDLLKIKTELISYLHLPTVVLSGISKLFSRPKIGHSLMESLRQCLEDHKIIKEKNAARMTVIVPQDTWKTEGCSDTLTFFGINSFQTEEETVTLRCTSDCCDDVKTIFHLLNIFFESDSDSDFCGDDDDTITGLIENDAKNDQVVQSSSSSTIVRGLPPSTRRSIALDFNASFQSQASVEASQHLEIPEHLNVKNRADNNGSESLIHEKQDNSSLGSNENENQSFNAADRLIAPKPVLPSSQSNQNPVDYEVCDSAHKSKRFQYHGATSTNMTLDPLDTKLLRTPQKSPMFYRDSDSQEKVLLDTQGQSGDSNVNTNIDNQTSMTQKTNLSSQVTPFSPVTVNPAYFVPIISPNEAALSIQASSSSVVYPTPKRPVVYSKKESRISKSKTKIQNPYVPAPSVASGLVTKTFDYSSIVDKLSRLSSSDLSESGQSSRRGSAQYSGSDERLEKKKSSPRGGTKMQLVSPRVTKATSLIKVSPPDGASGNPVNGSHLHSRSFDSSTGKQKDYSNLHKYTMSQDGATFLAMKQSEFSNGHRRASADTVHSRASSHASWSSSSSSQRRKRDQRDSARAKKPFKKTESNQSFELVSPRVSYPSDMTPKENLWYIGENNGYGKQPSTMTSSLPTGFTTQTLSRATHNSPSAAYPYQFTYNSVTIGQPYYQQASMVRGIIEETSEFQFSEFKRRNTPDPLTSSRSPSQSYPSDFRMNRNTPDPLPSHTVNLAQSSPRSEHRSSTVHRFKGSKTPDILSSEQPRLVADLTTYRRHGLTLKPKSEDPYAAHSKSLSDQLYDHSMHIPLKLKKSTPDPLPSTGVAYPQIQWARTRERKTPDFLISDQPVEHLTSSQLRRPQPIYMKESVTSDYLDSNVMEPKLIAWSSAQPTQLQQDGIAADNSMSQIKLSTSTQVFRPEAVNPNILYKHVQFQNDDGMNTNTGRIRKTPDPLDSHHRHSKLPVTEYPSIVNPQTRILVAPSTYENPSKHTKTGVAFV